MAKMNSIKISTHKHQNQITTLHASYENTCSKSRSITRKSNYLMGIALGWMTAQSSEIFLRLLFYSFNTLKPCVDFFFSSDSKVFFVCACSRSNCSYRLLSHPVSAYKNVVSMLYSNRKASKRVTISQHSFQGFFGFESINGVSFRPRDI